MKTSEKDIRIKELEAEVARLKALNPTPIDKDTLLGWSDGRHGKKELVGSLFLSAFARTFPIGSEKHDNQDFKALIDAKQISLVLVANGIPMDAVEVCREWDKQVDRAVEEKARELVHDKLYELMEALDNAKESFKRHATTQMDKAGISGEDRE